MNNDLKDIELIDAYLLGGLTDDDSKKVVERLEHDSDFNAMYLLQKDLIHHLEETRNRELKNYLIESERNNTNNIQSRKVKAKVLKLNVRSFLKYAASIVFVFAFSWYLYDKLSLDSPSEIYASNFEPYPNDWQIVKRSSSSDDIKYRAMSAYQAGLYSESLELIKEIEVNETIDTLTFFKAMTLMNSNKLNDAKEILEGLYPKNDWDYQEPIRWYLSLIYLKQEDIDNARKFLIEITNTKSEHFQKTSAQKILNELDRNSIDSQK